MRVRALLRRANIETSRKLTAGNLELDADGMTATVDGEEIPVTTREFNILYKLLSYPKKTMPERSKYVRPTIVSTICALIGTAFVAGSVFAVTASPPIVWLCILLAVPGFLGRILPYFIYSRGVAKRTADIAPFLEAKYNEIDKICEKGHSLL